MEARPNQRLDRDVKAVLWSIMEENNGCIPRGRRNELMKTYNLRSVQIRTQQCHYRKKHGYPPLRWKRDRDADPTAEKKNETEIEKKNDPISVDQLPFSIASLLREPYIPRSTTAAPLIWMSLDQIQASWFRNNF